MVRHATGSAPAHDRASSEHLGAMPGLRALTTGSGPEPLAQLPMTATSATPLLPTAILLQSGRLVMPPAPLR